MSTTLSRMRHAAVLAVGLFGFSAFGAVHAAGTDAGSVVSNTFTLDYQVNSVNQTQITPAAPTTFTVDRTVDLTVASQGDINVSPGATGQQLIFSVRNDGNDNQAYALSIDDLAGDDFDAAIAASATIYLDDGDGAFEPGAGDGAGTSYTLGGGSASPDIAPDDILWVVISGDIPGGATDGQQDGVILLADSLNPTTSLDPLYSATPGDETLAAGGANNLDGEAQNVLADGAGTATADAANDGAHSDTASYIVTAANLTAAKTVAVVATDSTAIDCSVDPVQAGNQYAVPGACVEYVISATNDAGAAASATSINISDTLPDEVAFVSAADSGFTGGTLSSPGGACTTSCVVSFSGGSLDPGDTGTITIRATVR